MTTTNPEWSDMHHFSIADYHRMGEAGIFEGQRVELLRGKIVDMSPINSNHAGMVKRLMRLLSSLLDASYILSVQDPISIGQDSEPQPDLAVLKFREDFYSRAHPTPEDTLLIIEVADTSLAKDQKVKLPLYASAGIPEVWIVNLPGQQMERYRQPAQERYTDIQIFLPGDRMETEIVGPLEVELVLGQAGAEA